MKREPTKFTGVFERQSTARTFNNKPDVCFDIAYRVDGKLKWEKIGWLSEGYTAKLAEQVRAERLRSIRHGIELPQKTKAPYFEDIALKYKTWTKENKASYAADISRIDSYLIPALGKERLTDISTFRLEKFKSDLIKKGLAPASVKHCLVLVRQIYNKAMVWGLYKGENPIKGVKMPAVQNQRERFLSYEEAKLLLDELQKVSAKLHDMAVISLHCGLRAGEIFSIKDQDIDLENGIITILDPKNKNARKAFMTDAARDILTARMTDRNEYIFPDRIHGEKAKAVSFSFSKIVNRLFNQGVTDNRQRVSFHTLRHTFASWLALQGESLMTIRELLGHKSFEMTKRYAHLIPDEKRKATMRLEEKFNEKSNNALSKGNILTPV